MPGNKWKGCYDSGRKYNKSWEEKYVWVCRASDGSETAFRKICKTSIAPRASRLADHEKSKGHMNRISASSQCRALPVNVTPRKNENEIKRIELELAVSITCHCSISSADHLGEIVKRNGKGSELENLHLHRTKCSKLISKVISPALFDEVKEDVKGKKYSLLVDESTDVAINKHLCIVLRYYSNLRCNIVTELGGLVPVVGTTGRELFETLSNTLKEIGLEWSNCVGFGSDGASSMVGEHNSVWSRIREQSPNCQLNRCVCHSLSLCIEKAFDKLPSNLGYILQEVPKWFSKSTIRREAFKELFMTMDPNEERKGTPLPFQKLSCTRWLVRGKVIYNLLTNWEELKAYFIVAYPNADASCRYKARELFEMLNDPVNLIYFHFMSPIVTEFERVNSLFQTTDGDPVELLKELTLHHKSLRDRLLDKSGKPLSLNAIDFGAKFSHESDRFLLQHHHSDEAMRKIEEVKNRCAKMLTEALHQVEKRLPASTGIFKGLSALSPCKVLSQTERVPFKDLPAPHLLKEKENLIEQQYRKIIHVSWAEESIFKGQIPKKSSSFWSGIVQYTSSTGEKPFEELGNYALACLTTPTSNAVVERMFSTVTNVKTKSRNRLGSEMLEAIIRVRSHLLFQGKCCRDFKVTPPMLELFNSTNMYERSTEEDEADNSFFELLNFND